VVGLREPLIVVDGKAQAVARHDVSKVEVQCGRKKQKKAGSCVVREQVWRVSQTLSLDSGTVLI
jgi:hypothetical protein